jgi:hypothetical protein
MVSYDHEICGGDITNLQKFIIIFRSGKKCVNVYWNFKLTAGCLEFKISVHLAERIEFGFR